MPDPVQNTPPNPKDSQGSGAKGNVTEGKVVLEVNGEKKEFGASDIQNLLAQQASATQKTQQVAAIIDAAKKYGLDPEAYISHAEGAFGAMTRLVDNGIIDEQGNIIGKDKLETPPPTQNQQTVPKQTPVDSAVQVPKELTDALEKLNKRLEGLETTQTGMMRESLQSKVVAKHPDLDEADVSRLFGIAMQDSSKSLWQHAEEMSKAKKESMGTLREGFAKEFGIDLENWNANKTREQSAEGGAGAFLGSKKISFNAKGNDPDATTPRKAMQEFIRAKFGG